MATLTSVQAVIDELGFSTYQRRVLIIAGVGWAADAMEMYVMALILPELADEWNLSAQQLGIMGGAVFAGMGLGAWAWGTYADSYGRRKGYVLTLALATVFGFASALSRSYIPLLLLRIGFGFGVGGFLPVSSTLLLESIPREWVAPAFGISSMLFTAGAGRIV